MSLQPSSVPPCVNQVLLESGPVIERQSVTQRRSFVRIRERQLEVEGLEQDTIVLRVSEIDPASGITLRPRRVVFVYENWSPFLP